LFGTLELSCRFINIVSSVAGRLNTSIIIESEMNNEAREGEGRREMGMWGREEERGGGCEEEGGRRVEGELEGEREGDGGKKEEDQRKAK
jgi:hypothetical protein